MSTSSNPSPAPEATATGVIGVFDSGVGGLTVLRALQTQMPGTALHYVADTAHAPYGPRSADYITERSLRLAAYLQDQGASLLVVACNTATAHAIAALRQRWPDLPIVGTEPGIKPAVAASLARVSGSAGRGRIGVLATVATIASARYQDLISRHAEGIEVFSQPCPGLVDLIERGQLDTPELHALLDRLCQPLRDARVDTVLMGCTHYPLVQGPLQQALGPAVQLLNIETAVAQRAAALWNKQAMPLQTAHSLRLETTGDAAQFQRFVQQVLGWSSAQAAGIQV